MRYVTGVSNLWEHLGRGCFPSYTRITLRLIGPSLLDTGKGKGCTVQAQIPSFPRQNSKELESAGA